MNALNLIHWNKALTLLNTFDYSHAIIIENYGKLKNELYGTGHFRINIPAENTDIFIYMCELTGTLYEVVINTIDGYYIFVDKQLNKRRIRNFMKKIYDGMAEPHCLDKIYVVEGSRLHRFLNALSQYVTRDKMPADRMCIIH